MEDSATASDGEEEAPAFAPMPARRERKIEHARGREWRPFCHVPAEALRRRARACRHSIITPSHAIIFSAGGSGARNSEFTHHNERVARRLCHSSSPNTAISEQLARKENGKSAPRLRRGRATIRRCRHVLRCRVLLFSRSQDGRAASSRPPNHAARAGATARCPARSATLCSVLRVMPEQRRHPAAPPAASVPPADTLRPARRLYSRAPHHSNARRMSRRHREMSRRSFFQAILLAGSRAATAAAVFSRDRASVRTAGRQMPIDVTLTAPLDCMSRHFAIRPFTHSSRISRAAAATFQE